MNKTEEENVGFKLLLITLWYFSHQKQSEICIYIYFWYIYVCVCIYF